jgi:predicted permease
MGQFVPDQLQDLKYAFRTIRRSPGFLAVVVVSIAIGVAANTTIFSIANAVLFGALPVHEPHRLVNLSNDRRGTEFSYADYLDLRQCEAFEGLAASFPLAPVSFNAGESPERIWGALVSGDYFGIIGVPMSLGRGILPEEEQHRDAVVVLSNALWKRRFGGDPEVFGRTITMNNAPWRVVGVTAPGFRGSTRMLVDEFWVPLSMHEVLVPEITRTEPLMSRDSEWLFLDARLKPGVSRTQGLAAVNVINARMDPLHPNRYPSKILLEPSGNLPGELSSGVQGLFAGLMIVVGLVLAIACANVANLLLARAAGRHREIAMRLAVGASRRRLIRQFLTESVLLSTIGAAAGYLLSFWTTGAIARVDLPIPIPVDMRFAPDFRVLAFTAAVSLIAGVLFGLAPAIRATRPDLAEAIKGADLQIGVFRRFGLRNALVVTQVTFSLVLLISAALFLRSLGRASSINLGMNPAPVASIAFDPNQHASSPERIGQFLDQVQQRVLTLPGIESVSYVDFVPLTVIGEGTQFGRGESPKIPAAAVKVGTRYFETMGIPLLAGRDFGREGKAPVVIVNRALAEKLFPGQSPLGRQVSDPQKAYTVIGVVANAKQRRLGDNDFPCAYLPLEQNIERIMSITGVALVAKAANPAAALDSIRREIRAIDPNLATYNALTMRDQVEKAMLLPRLMATLFGVFGIAGLALAVVGLYGVMSFSVGRRTREIGIRMALGAQRSQILAMVTRQGLALTAVGVVVGWVLAFATSRFAESLLYGVSPRDLVTFLAVPLLLGAVGFLASFVPARRAAKLNPMSALRYE